MEANSNFGREYRCAIGKAGKSGFEIGMKTPANPIPLHIEFSIEKTDLQSQNTGRVTLWNLNKQHLAALEEKDCCLVLKAGYGSRLSLIFSGIVSHATTKMDGADRRTEIEVIDNLVEVRDTFVSVSYVGIVNWKTIMNDVAAQMGVAVTYAYNAEFADIPNGFSYVGQAKNIMDKGCACCGLTWSLQNGVMQVKRPGDVMSREVYVLSPDTGMIGVPSRVSEADSNNEKSAAVGWEVNYLLNGAINIDDYVRLESQAVTGFFRASKIAIQGDNVSGDWMCTGTFMEVK